MSVFDLIQQKTSESQRRRQVEELIAQLNRNEEEARLREPKDGKRREPFLESLREALRRCQGTGGEETAPVDASLHCYVTENRLHAYVCLLPPMNGGRDLSPVAFGRALQSSGITAGIDEEAALELMRKKPYLRILPIARGHLARDGANGTLEYFYRVGQDFPIDGEEGTAPDFSLLRPVQLVRKGEAVCRITRPRKGKDGVDVSGAVTPARPGKHAPLPKGENLVISEDRLQLLAAEDGAVFLDENGKPFLRPALLRWEGVEKSETLDGLTYVYGDVKKGVTLRCEGDLLVMGEIRGATVSARGSVRSQKGIRNAVIQAEGQVLAPVIRDSEVRAGGSVFGEKLLDSRVTAAGNVYALGGEGLICGGSVQAKERIECIRLGDESQRLTSLCVGRSAELEREQADMTAELEEAQTTLDRLRKSVLSLRMAGEVLSEQNRLLLRQLNEQKTLYERQIAELESGLKRVREELQAARHCKIRCKVMEPVVAVQLGDRSREFRFSDTNCSFRIYAGQLLSK